ncbi:meteorin-like protein isoform X1 [Poecilia latipinna]|uniref:meteorin-like protein isoform X1 n=1 Tax=Poecilia latipinna TaxID=48699 RepID=UPI00072E3D67|nr:PREDICTED: meteorin-like protein isoform X1 [Poecilia latipinna]
MLPAVIVLACLPVLALHCAADLCNWTGSGFPAGVDRRVVLQVRLRCTEGLVSWVYPGQALRVALEPNLSSIRYNRVCIQPSPSLSGASVFIERAGELELLETEDGGRTGRQVFCFRADGPHSPVIYLQAGTGPQSPGTWIRRTVGFRYELLRNRSVYGGLEPSCRPCNDTELLMAVCSSDFVVRGYIKNVFHDSRRQSSLVEVLTTKVYWQRSGMFEQQMRPHMSPQSWHGHIRTLLQCHVKPGDGQFLFTGSEHFGEAWLGCAPRYKDFLSVYHKARMGRRTSCDFPLD